MIRLGVDDGDGCVAVGLFLHKDSGRGFADDIAPSCDNDVFASGVDLTFFEQCFYAERGAGEKAGIVSEKHFADVDGVEPVDVFFWMDSGCDRFFIHVGREGELDEDPIDVCIVVKSVNLSEKIGLGNGVWKMGCRREDAGFLAGFIFCSNIGMGGGMIADENKGKTRFSASDLSDLFCDVGLDLGGDFFPVDDFHGIFRLRISATAS